MLFYCSIIPATTAVNKVVVEFKHAFWPEEFGVFVRAVSTHEARGYLQTWINIYKILHKPVLVSFVGGEAAVKIEKMSEEDAKQNGNFYFEEKKKEKITFKFLGYTTLCYFKILC